MATTPYADVTKFTSLTIAPSSYVTDIEESDPGWLLAQLVHWSAWINSQLRKRYAIPFEAPYPETAINWLVAIVTVQLYLKVGVDTTDGQLATVVKASDDAKAEVAAAANAPEGHWELPPRADRLDQSAVSKGGVLAYGEQSPYTWTTNQAELGREEDQGL